MSYSSPELRNNLTLSSSSKVPTDTELSNNNSTSSSSQDEIPFLGIAIALGVLITLGMNRNEDIFTILSGNIVEIEEEMSEITKTVVGTAISKSGTELVSISVGEGISGIISALTTSAITRVVSLFIKGKEPGEEGTDTNQSTSGEDTPRIQQSLSKRTSAFSNAVADGDYFLTRATVLTLLESLGIPYTIADVFSVLFANIPYQFMKFTNTVNSQKNSNDNKDSKAEVNLVELFADVTKWLEYDILAADFASKTSLYAINPHIESAGFGLFAGLSSQVYADLLYKYSTFGTEKARLESVRRPFSDTLQLYFDICLSNAILFGVYTTIRKPISRELTNLLSGGVDSCLGSANYNLCTESFLNMNPPEASIEAQFRAFVISIIGLSDRFLDFDIYQLYIDGDNAGYLRSLLVTLYSLLRYYFAFLFEGEFSIV